LSRLFDLQIRSILLPELAQTFQAITVRIIDRLRLLDETCLVVRCAVVLMIAEVVTATAEHGSSRLDWHKSQ